MGQAAPFKNSFQPDELEELQTAFNAIWAAFKANRAFSDCASEEELRRLVSERLCALARCGVKDAERLQTLTLVTLQSRSRPPLQGTSS
jgi:hypothetical protein